MATYNAPYDRTNWRRMVLSQTQMQENAIYIYDYMATKYKWNKLWKIRKLWKYQTSCESF